MSTTIFQKTDLGREEVSSRNQGLSAKLRRLLILVDGQRTVEALRAASGLLDETDALIAQLMTIGLIADRDAMGVVAAPVAVAAVTPVAVAIITPAPAVSDTAHAVVALPTPAVVTSAAPTPPVAEQAIQIDPARLAGVKQLMLDSTRQYLGLMGADIQRRIETANDAETLKGCVVRWSLAMRESRQGSAVAGMFLDQVRAVLG